MIALAVMDVVKLAVHQPSALDRPDFGFFPDPVGALGGGPGFPQSVGQREAIFLK